jgi:predicted small lipoprotein YifL
MNERQPMSLAACRGPAPRAVFGRLVPGLAALALGLLAGCGQKGPLFLPSTNGAPARAVERAPSAPDDAMPRGPVTVPSPATK